jgi:hypothetical protein
MKMIYILEGEYKFGIEFMTSIKGAWSSRQHGLILEGPLTE